MVKFHAKAARGTKSAGGVALENGLSVAFLQVTSNCWGVIGLDVEDGPDGNKAKYQREMIEYGMDCDGNGKKPGMSNANGEIDSDRSDNYSKFNGFGNTDSWKGIYRS